MKKTIFILLALISIAGCNNDLKPKELEKGYIEGLQEKKKKAEDAAEKANQYIEKLQNTTQTINKEAAEIRLCILVEKPRTAPTTKS